jgi:hypothetical protein
MNLTQLPNELLCNILMFLSHEDYFNAIESNIFPIDEIQYNKNKVMENLEVQLREKSYRIRQGKILISSCFKPLLSPENREFVERHIDEWDDEIDQYFLSNDANPTGPATQILTFIMNTGL